MAVFLFVCAVFVILVLTSRGEPGRYTKISGPIDGTRPEVIQRRHLEHFTGREWEGD